MLAVMVRNNNFTFEIYMLLTSNAWQKSQNLCTSPHSISNGLFLGVGLGISHLLFKSDSIKVCNICIFMKSIYTLYKPHFNFGKGFYLYPMP